MEETVKKLVIFFLFPLLFLNALTFMAIQKLQPDFLMRVNFYDVGQGDSVFIQTHLGNQILIDGGPSDKVLSYLGKDMPFYDREIDLIILTHAHADHVGGLIDVLKRYKVKKIMLPEAEFHSAGFDQFLSLIEQKDVTKIYSKEGQRIYLDTATVFDVYYPPGKFEGKNLKEGFGLESQDLNDTSVVGKLSFGKTQVLLTGDAGSLIENIILPKYNLDSDLLKVGHHGSRFSTSMNFLQEVTPEFAVIQAGKNNYGHPTEQTLSNLNHVGAQIFRNDTQGTIKFVSDGVNLWHK